MDVTLEAARAVAGTLAAALLTFLVFVLSSLLIIAQAASAQLTPRVIALVFQSRLTKFLLAAVVFDYTFTLIELSRLEAPIPLFSATL